MTIMGVASNSIAIAADPLHCRSLSNDSRGVSRLLEGSRHLLRHLQEAVTSCDVARIVRREEEIVRRGVTRSMTRYEIRQSLNDFRSS